MHRKLNIVLAEDDDLVRDCVRGWLAGLGHEVTAVGGGGPLVDACRDSNPDLVISDVGMPDLDGVSAATAIRRRSAVPVILVSGAWRPDELERARAAGVARCMAKPVLPLELAAAIESVHPEAGPPPADPDGNRGAFLGALAHELRNLLAPLSADADRLRVDGQPPDVRRVGERIGRGVRRMSALVDELYDADRVCRGKIRLTRGRVDARALVADAAEAVRPAMDAAGHTLAVAVVPDPLWLDADPDRLTQALVNLLTNAAKYTPDGGRVEVTAARDGGEVVLRVRDSGVGIRPEHLETVFELYAQVPRSVPSSRGGLGLGLALVRQVVALHGGTVGAESAGEGRGSEFTVRLPAADR